MDSIENLSMKRLGIIRKKLQKKHQDLENKAEQSKKRFRKNKKYFTRFNLKEINIPLEDGDFNKKKEDKSSKIKKQKRDQGLKG